MVRLLASLSETIERLLDDERDALLTGDFEKIVKLNLQKEVLFEKLEKEAPKALSNSLSLRNKALSNQKLIDSSMRGIRTVIDRIAEIESACAKLNTYDQKGTRRTLKASKTTVEKIS